LKTIYIIQMAFGGRQEISAGDCGSSPQWGEQGQGQRLKNASAWMKGEQACIAALSPTKRQLAISYGDTKGPCPRVRYLWPSRASCFH